jgi:hypothetical protein
MKVKKEVTVAIFIGLILGGIVVGGILRARKALNNFTPVHVTQNSPVPSTTSAPQQGLFLTIDTPDNQVVKEASFILTGKTLPGTYIVINGEAGDSIIVPNELGNFSQTITLVKGANTIRVTAYQEDGTKQESTINAVYTTAEI